MLQLTLTGVGTFVVRVLTRLGPQHWCPPRISLRLFQISSEPGTALMAADLRRHLPPSGWRTRTDLEYAPATGRDGRFDLVLPAGPGPHPLVVWVHGGGWFFGSKADVLPYVEQLAVRGFAGAVVNYPRAPRARHPSAPRAVNAALRHLLDHAEEYEIDPSRIVLAGDSAGAQVAAELAVLCTNPTYAATTALEPALGPEQLRGTLLFCGIFDPAALDDADRVFEAVLGSAMWSVSGTRNWKQSRAVDLMNVRARANSHFPPTFLAAGDADPLTRRQTAPFAERLRSLDVRVEDYRPGEAGDPAHHEFQFRLGTPPGDEALDRATRFLEDITSNSH